MFYRVIRVNYWSLYILKNNKILNRLCIVSARIKKFLVWLLVSGKAENWLLMIIIEESFCLFTAWMSIWVLGGLKIYVQKQPPEEFYKKKLF